MKFKPIVRTGAVLVGVLLTLITLMAIGVFALVPAASNFTNVLILTMVLMQLLTVVVLIHIHDVLIGDFKKGRR
ncbi:MAG: hypothetical protein QW751_00770 [Candidatus Aenigmatarchaeota archaeon]|nr:hypothetical protein [Candidatus Aenigmarchaeota archaeon]